MDVVLEVSNERTAKNTKNKTDKLPYFTKNKTDKLPYFTKNKTDYGVYPT
jgi:predicted peptidase